jgi:hypothetical protein
MVFNHLKPCMSHMTSVFILHVGFSMFCALCLSLCNFFSDSAVGPVPIELLHK